MIATLKITEPSPLKRFFSCLPKFVKFLFVISWTLFSNYNIWSRDLMFVHSILSFDI